MYLKKIKFHWCKELGQIVDAVMDLGPSKSSTKSEMRRHAKDAAKQMKDEIGTSYSWIVPVALAGGLLLYGLKRMEVY